MAAGAEAVSAHKPQRLERSNWSVDLLAEHVPVHATPLLFRHRPQTVVVGSVAIVAVVDVDTAALSVPAAPLLLLHRP